MRASLILRDFDGVVDILAWKGVTLLPAKKTFDMAVAAADLVCDKPNASVCEIGTGTGVFPVTISKLLSPRKDVSIVATDISGGALEAASINAAINNVPNDIRWIQTNGLSGVSAGFPGFDVIFSNPPFTRSGQAQQINKSGFHPDSALDGGSNGAQYYKQFVDEAVPLLNQDGLLIFQLPLEKDAIGTVVSAVRPKYERLPHHLIYDAGQRYTNSNPLFLTIGGNGHTLNKLNTHKYVSVAI